MLTIYIVMNKFLVVEKKIQSPKEAKEKSLSDVVGVEA